jgi:hypothetical protein
MIAVNILFEITMSCFLTNINGMTYIMDLAIRLRHDDTTNMCSNKHLETVYVPLVFYQAKNIHIVQSKYLLRNTIEVHGRNITLKLTISSETALQLHTSSGIVYHRRS